MHPTRRLLFAVALAACSTPSGCSEQAPVELSLQETDATAAWTETLSVAPAEPITGLSRRSDTPFYYSDGSGQPIFFLGYYMFEVVSDTSYDLDRWVADLQAAGVNYIRINPMATRDDADNPPSSSGTWYEYADEDPMAGNFAGFSNLLHPFVRTSTCCTKLSTVHGPSRGKWDLFSSNADYYDRLRSLIAAARDHGIYVHVSIWSEITLKASTRADRYDGSPWNPDNNINGSTGMPPTGSDGRSAFYATTPETLDTLRQAQNLYFDSVVNATREFPNVFYEVGNEVSADASWQTGWIERLKILAPGKLVTQDVGNQPSLSSVADGVTRHWAEDGMDGHGRAGHPERNETEIEDLRGFGMMSISDSDREFKWGKGDPKSSRAAAWHALCSGGHFALMTYEMAYDYPTLTLDPDVVAGFRALRAFLQWSRLPLDLMSPADSLKLSGTADVLSGAGHVVAYLRDGGTVRIDVPAGTHDAYWYNPQTAELTPTGTETAGAIDFTPPASGDWVLYLRQR